MVGESPIKFRILELYLDGKEHWHSEVVHQIQKEYNMNSDYGRDSINFDIIELVSGGMLSSVESKVDETGEYKKGFLMHKYVITDFGRVRASDACLEYV